MQLSSALLSAAALFAQVASGFHLSLDHDRDNLATYRDPSIGFYEPPQGRLMHFDLDDEGNLVVSGYPFDFAFFNRGDGSWRLEAAHPDESRTAIRGPFANETNVLVYKGEKLVLHLCGRYHALNISLAPRGFAYDRSKEECAASVPLYVRS